MIARLVLSDSLRQRILDEALKAAPRECCGLVEGTRSFAGDELVAEATRVHRARNVAAGADRFEIDPADHFHVLREARERGTEIIGCYHSHPGGKPVPSALDSEAAWGDDFLWLIAAAPELKAFVFESGAPREVAIAVPEQSSGPSAAGTI